MKILQITCFTYLCGTTRHVLVLAETLQQRGHDVTLVCPSDGWLPEQARRAGIAVIESDTRGSQSGKAVWRLAKWVREEKIDVIHAHGTRASYCGYVLGRLTNRPVISSLHILSHDLLYRKILPRKGSRIVTVSEFLRDGLLTSGVSGAYVQTIYNGTPLPAEPQEEGDGARHGPPAQVRTVPEPADGLTVVKTPQRMEAEAAQASVRTELGLPPDADLVGVFGQVHEPKGQSLVVRAMRAILLQRPRAHFLFVGNIFPADRQALCALATAEGVDGHLRFTGLRDDVPRLMAAIDIVAIPSEMETFSLVAVEAMALGKPVVAAHVGGLPEVVADQVTGLLVDRDPVALAAAIVALLQDPGRRAAMGHAAQDRVRTCFSARRMVNDIEALYREMLENRS